jgi:hypothetical protein
MSHCNTASFSAALRSFILGIKMLPFPVVGLYYLTCLPLGEHIICSKGRALCLFWEVEIQPKVINAEVANYR